MQPHQERVVTEKAELDEKRMKLDAFIDSDNQVFRGLPKDEQARLGRQLEIRSTPTSANAPLAVSISTRPTLSIPTAPVHLAPGGVSVAA